MYLNEQIKKLLSILFLFASLSLFSQKKDTLFLLRELRNTPYPFYHAVYIDHSRKAQERVTKFSFDKYGNDTYYEELKDLGSVTRQGAILRNRFPRQWTELHLYKGKYYLYDPSELSAQARFKITDSTTINYTMEGPEPSVIKNVTVLSPASIVINLHNYWGGKMVRIDIIDTAKGIAVFSFGPAKNNRSGYKLLMVDVRKAYLFPTIVNYCVTDRQNEFTFERIDFTFLLKNITGKAKNDRLQ